MGVTVGDWRGAKNTSLSPRTTSYEHGKLIHKDMPDCKKWWSDDSVAFLTEMNHMEPKADDTVGCSFTLENALVEAGLPPRHQ